MPPEPKRKIGLGIPKNFDPLKIELPFSSEEFLAAWENFVEHRKEIRSPLTPAACQAIFRKLKKHPEATSIESLYISAERRWKGVFPESVPEVVNKRILPPEIEAMLAGMPRHFREQKILELVVLGILDPMGTPQTAIS